MGAVITIAVAAVVAWYTQRWDLLLEFAKSYGAMAGAVVAGVSAAAGSIASQLVARKIGVQDGFSWKQVAISAFTAGATQGIVGDGKGMNPVVYGAQKSLVGQGVAILINPQTPFSWKSVAIAAIVEPINQSVVGDPQAASKFSDSFASNLGRQFIATAIRTEVSIAVYDKGQFNFANVAADAFGNALGNSIVAGMKRSEQDALEAKRQARALDYDMADDGFFDEKGNEAILERMAPQDAAQDEEIARAIANPKAVRIMDYSLRQVPGPRQLSAEEAAVGKQIKVSGTLDGALDSFFYKDGYDLSSDPLSELVEKNKLSYADIVRLRNVDEWVSSIEVPIFREELAKLGEILQIRRNELGINDPIAAGASMADYISDRTEKKIPVIGKAKLGTTYGVMSTAGQAYEGKYYQAGATGADTVVEGGVGWALAAGGLHPLVALVGGLLTSEVVKPLYYEFVPDHRLDDYTPELISKRITTRVNESLKAHISSAVDGRTILHYQTGNETVRISPADIQHYLLNRGKDSPYRSGMLNGLNGYDQ